MLSLSNFRKQLFKAFAEMVERPEVAYKVYHRRKVYVVSILPTDEKITKPYHVEKPVIKNKTGVCKECKSLTVNGICLNTQCTTSTIKEKVEA